jgi:ribosome biogenesis GTPase
VGLSVEGSDLEEAFSDLSGLASQCRFRDCAHSAEPGCAVQAALAEGRLDPRRYGNYLRMRREMAFQAARSDERLWREREDQWRTIGNKRKQVKQD